MKKLILILLPVLAVSCSKKDPVERVEHLQKVSGEWTKSQTDEAIDLYIEGLHKQEALLEENMRVNEQTLFFRRSKCDDATLEKRSKEIEEAEASIDKRRAALIQQYSQK